MGTLTIDKKKFVVIEQKEFDKLQLLAAQKTTPARKLSLLRLRSCPCTPLPFACVCVRNK